MSMTSAPFFAALQWNAIEQTAARNTIERNQPWTFSLPPITISRNLGYGRATHHTRATPVRTASASAWQRLGLPRESAIPRSGPLKVPIGEILGTMEPDPELLLLLARIRKRK